MSAISRDSLCDCGRAAREHARDDLQLQVALRLIRQEGPIINVSIIDGDTYEVPRLYIALHGIHALYLPELAKRYGWAKK